ncbi:arylsulfatase [Proteus mirabilis]|uniref:Arylsulfatase n=1 Tax=Proteus mirabilis TaxID=584 RepID=A0A379GEG0_PROMI|nr:arylsulfatase [Proteus mirabilis]
MVELEYLLLLNQPGTIPAGTKSDAMISALDILPTALQVADIQILIACK